MSIGQILILCAIPLGLLAGVGAAIEDDVEKKRSHYGIYFIISIIVLLVMSYLAAKTGHCTMSTAIKLTEYCGPGLMARAHIASYIAVVFIGCAFIVSIIKRFKRRAKTTP